MGPACMDNNADISLVAACQHKLLEHRQTLRSTLHPNLLQLFCSWRVLTKALERLVLGLVGSRIDDGSCPRGLRAELLSVVVHCLVQGSAAAGQLHTELRREAAAVQCLQRSAELPTELLPPAVARHTELLLLLAVRWVAQGFAVAG